MGCDIHAFLEVKIQVARIVLRSAGRDEEVTRLEWFYYGKPTIDRDEELFGRMADCGRGDEIEKIAPNRGVPDDAAHLTKLLLNQYGGDGHSHSWLSAKEMEELDDWWLKLRGLDAPNMMGYPSRSLFARLDYGSQLYVFGLEIAEWWRTNNFDQKPVKDMRLLFFFDN